MSTRVTQSFPPRRRLTRSVLAVAVLLAVEACSSQKPGIRIDPDAFGSDQGTLIAIDDVRSVAQVMIDSLNGSPRVAALRKEKTPLRILVGEFKQRTSIAIFDKTIFVNRLLSSLMAADQDGAYSFIQRDAVKDERELQQSGAVENQVSGRMAGADFVLSGEVREILHREASSGGGELEKRTIQYSLRLTDVAGGTLVWADAHEVVKQQIIGAVYR